MLDALTLLTADHNRVRGLFSRFGAAKEAGDTEAMAELADLIDTEIEGHTTIEERVFYPWARELSEEIAEVVAEGVEEHHVVEVLMGEVRQLAPGDDEWVAKLAVVIENVEHHAAEEEEDLFPQVRRAADRGALESVAGDLEAAKRDLGAPVLADKQDKTTEELHRLATAQEIPGRSSMGHDELAATVSPG
ncbi:MAG TPA: hemerythrin domain-containing protein [Acidimicrobiales bacterium]|nr:hemerythrin domain-containing protein [Acidimicrobiales bacterium]